MSPTDATAGGMSSAAQHRTAAARARHEPIPVAIVTVSDSRTPEDDVSGQLIRSLVEAAGHAVVGYRIVKDEPEAVAASLAEFGDGRSRLVIFNGGTGISARDRTYDVISRAIEKPLPGFGELFRMLSYDQVGAAAMLSRATAGVYRGVLVFSLPGSPAAVRLALEQLILPEITHLAWEVGR